jgi:hypothetical protein
MSRVFRPFCFRPFARSRILRVALAALALLVLTAVPARAPLILSGVHCPPNLWVGQGTQFTHFNAMNPADQGGLVDCNDVVCTAWLATSDIPVGSGWIQGRPIAGATVTFHAVREDGQTSYTVNAVTDVHGQATARFDDLDVDGSYYHDHCATTPSTTWECYEFYATYAGIALFQEHGECLLRLACESNHQYYLLEDSEVPISDCWGLPGCIDEWGGFWHQMNLTLTVDAGALGDAIVITIDQPPLPPPIGIPSGAAIVDWRQITAGGATFAIPATAALDYSSSTLYGYGWTDTQIYYWTPGRSQWVPLPQPSDRSCLEHQIRWSMTEPGIYAMVAREDSEHDWLSDRIETERYHTNPYLFDSDGDQSPDGAEVLISRTDPLSPDTDEDNFGEILELPQGTDPNDPRDYPGAVDRGDHNAGNVKVTMTDKGTLGVVDRVGRDGLGIVYPAATTDTLLYVGSVWAGTGPEYVVNRDYADDTHDWEVAAEPDGHVVVDATPEIDQRIRASFVDSGHPLLKWLRVYQESAAWAAPPENEYVLERLVVVNEGEEPLAGLYVGQFMDLDINQLTASQNRGTTDLTRDLVYMWRNVPTPYVGVRLIEPTPPRNVTLIHNPTFVWPNARVLDADKYGFLAATAPQYIVHDAPTSDDWSVLVSAGPFDLVAGQSVTIGFAIVAAGTSANLLANADRARARYFEVYGGGGAVGDDAGAAGGGLRLAAMPNPLVSATSIRYSMPAVGRVSLLVYDPSGRLVQAVLDGATVAAGEHAVRWDARDAAGRTVAPGIYLYRLTTGAERRSGRLVVVR